MIDQDRKRLTHSEKEGERALAMDSRLKSALMESRHKMSSGVVGEVKKTSRACPTLINLIII